MLLTILVGIAATVVVIYVLLGLAYGAWRIRREPMMYPTWRAKAKVLAVYAVIWGLMIVLWSIQHRGRPPR